MISTLFCLSQYLTLEIDKAIWHYTNSGKFEVRSCYHLAKSLANSTDPRTEKPQASGQSFSKSFWTTLWSLKIKKTNTNISLENAFLMSFLLVRIFLRDCIKIVTFVGSMS